MKTLVKWMVAMAFVVGSGVALADTDANRRDDKTASGEKAGGAKKKSYKCTCDSPCSGSITCTTGCYAFCEENPEGSGRHVCVKGCASKALSGKARKLDPDKKYASVHLSMPREKMLPVVQRLYGQKQAKPDKTARKPGAPEPATVSLKNADMATILNEVSK